MWAAICGSGFYRVHFDPSAGEPDRFYFRSRTDKVLIPPDILNSAERNSLERELLFEDLT
jgi:hypothetical protein